MSAVDKIIQRLRLVLSDTQANYQLHEPSFSGHELQYVSNCIRSGWVSSVGQYIDQFEFKLSEYTGISHTVAVVNGTAALHICYQLAGVEANDEVLLPALTFVATANAVRYCNAVPHFVDSENVTFGVDPYALKNYLQEIVADHNGHSFNKKTGRRIRALCVTHVFGQPANLDALLEVCHLYNLVLIEDAAEALGTFYKKQHVGSVARVAALSFNGNKIITTGGGGAILTNDKDLAKKAKHITTTAKHKHEWHFLHDQVAYNYRLPNLNAALGCAQLERLDEYVSLKRALAKRYQTIFSKCNHAKILKESPDAQSNYWLNALILSSEDIELRDNLLAALSEQKIASRPIWELMHRLPMYVNCPRMPLPVAESLWKRVILLPSSPVLMQSTSKNALILEVPQ